MNKLVKRLLTGTLAFATILTASLQGSEQILRRAVGYLPHIVEIDRTIFVERRMNWNFKV